MGDEKPFYTKSGLTTPFLRKLGELGEKIPKISRGVIKADLVLIV
jgi:hypothetical protein